MEWLISWFGHKFKLFTQRQGAFVLQLIRVKGFSYTLWAIIVVHFPVESSFYTWNLPFYTVGCYRNVTVSDSIMPVEGCNFIMADLRIIFYSGLTFLLLAFHCVDKVVYYSE